MVRSAAALVEPGFQPRLRAAAPYRARAQRPGRTGPRPAHPPVGGHQRPAHPGLDLRALSMTVVPTTGLPAASPPAGRTAGPRTGTTGRTRPGRPAPPDVRLEPRKRTRSRIPRQPARASSSSRQARAGDMKSLHGDGQAQGPAEVRGDRSRRGKRRQGIAHRGRHVRPHREASRPGISSTTSRSRSAARAAGVPTWRRPAAPSRRSSRMRCNR